MFGRARNHGKRSPNIVRPPLAVSSIIDQRVLHTGCPKKLSAFDQQWNKSLLFNFQNFFYFE